MAKMELKRYMSQVRKETHPERTDGFFMTPDTFDEMYNKTWERVYGYLSDGSVVHAQLMQVLAQKQEQENLVYLPPEYQLSDVHQPYVREPQSAAEVLFMPFQDRVSGIASLTSRDSRKYSDKIEDLAAEVGVHSVGITEPVRLSQDFIAQVVELQSGQDSIPFPTIMFIPDHGYTSLRSPMRTLIRALGNISYSLNHPTISFHLYDGGTGALVQQQEFGSLDQFLLTMQHMFSTTTIRQNILNQEIPMSQFLFDPEMVGLYGIDPSTKELLEEQRGDRWQVGLTLRYIYAPNAWDPKNYRWQLQQTSNNTSKQLASGTIPESVRLGRRFPSDEEKKYIEKLFSVGELVMGTSTEKVSTPLLAASEMQLAAAIAGMANAWKPILDMAHSEVLYSVLNSTWFTALSYGIAQRSRIHNSLQMPIQ